MFKSIQNYVPIGVGFERLGSVIFACPLFVHIVACLWVMQTHFHGDGPDENGNETAKGTWMEGDII